MKKTALIVLDWVWINNETLEENSLYLWNTPNLDKVLKTDKFSSLWASWKYVWVLDWYMWNSEVWHLTIWSGRILKQSIVEINDLFENNEFDKLETFLKLLDFSKKNNNRIHLLWMLWFAWVHAHQEHLYNLIKVIPSDINISLHLFSDGRDSNIKDSYWYLEELINFIKDYKNVEISSLSWRFYAMDRNKNYERNLESYNAIIWEWKKTNLNPLDYLSDSYKKEIYDEFIEPVSFENTNYLQENEACIVFNFRPDRAKQLTELISWDLKDIYYKRLENIFLTTFVKNCPEYRNNIFINKIEAKNTLAEVLSNKWIKQLHLAETEKFAHVTKYFNWLITDKFDWEEHILIPSHKVRSYDEDPDMSAYEIFETFKDNLDNYDFFVINYANWDMVGHTWDLESAIKAMETIDKVVWEMIKISKEKDIDLLFLADHWNCENMWNEECKNTAHTINPVPCFYIKSWELVKLKNSWWLADVSPTILDIMWIEKPSEMTWGSLLKNK